MIPALILWLIKRYSKRIRRIWQPAVPFQATVQYPVSRILLLLLTLLLYLKADAQEVLTFRILVKNEPAGHLIAEHSVTGKVDKVQVRSSFDFRLLFRYHLEIHEEIALFDNRLHYSRLLRKKNGEATVDRIKQRKGNRLEVHENGKISFQDIPGIQFHVLQLYFFEPKGAHQVYSEKFQQQIPLKQSGPHTYLLLLPDGNNNTYYYSNGICTKILINSTFYNAAIIRE